MTEHLKRLTELDPLHFRKLESHQWRRSANHCWIYNHEITWEIAGWMLSTMQQACTEIEEAAKVDTNAWGKGRERAALRSALRKTWTIATPENITACYLSWKESKQSSDAPRLEPTPLAEEPSQNPKVCPRGVEWPGVTTAPVNNATDQPQTEER